MSALLRIRHMQWLPGLLLGHTKWQGVIYCVACSMPVSGQLSIGDSIDKLANQLTGLSSVAGRHVSMSVTMDEPEACKSLACTVKARHLTAGALQAQ